MRVGLTGHTAQLTMCLSHLSWQSWSQRCILTTWCLFVIENWQIVVLFGGVGAGVGANSAQHELWHVYLSSTPGTYRIFLMLLTSSLVDNEHPHKR